MDYVYFALVVLFLVFLMVLISKLDARAKKKYRKEAYRLLETSGPDPKAVKDTIKGLSLYGGRWRKDKEFVKLIQRLQEKL